MTSLHPLCVEVVVLLHCTKALSVELCPAVGPDDLKVTSEYHLDQVFSGSCVVVLGRTIVGRNQDLWLQLRPIHRDGVSARRHMRGGMG